MATAPVITGAPARAPCSTLASTEPHPVLGEIARFLAATGCTASRFGVEALGDPNLVRELRQGRDMRRATLARIRRYIAEGDA
ncbi:hypothetical protein [Sphingomonas sp.]|uniref:hypothetical protein n=1 Tax=Sphingomonas sp. TaxID=28214 RepID=UPI003AFFFB31